MTGDRDPVLALLRDAETPSAPRPGYADRLHAELFDGDTQDRSAPVGRERRGSTGVRWMTAVAAAAVVLIVAAVGADRWIGRDDLHVVHGAAGEGTPTMVVTTAAPPVDVAAAAAACDTFASTAFGELTRLQALGQANGEFLRTVDEARVAAVTLRDALDLLVSDLAAAGVPESSLAGLDGAARRVGAAVQRPVETGRGFLRALQAAGESMLAAEGGLIAVGVPPCL